MSPYIMPSPPSPADSSTPAVKNGRTAATLPPIMASIGTVVIDVFDEPPSRHPLASLPTPTRTPSPTAHPKPAHLHVPMPASPTSGCLTPQLSLDAHPPAKDPTEVLGGGALYALLGARLFLPPDRLRTLVDRAPRALPTPANETLAPEPASAGLVRRSSALEQQQGDVGHVDLPEKLERQLEAFGRDMWEWNEGASTRMTRSRIKYEGDVRLWQSLVPPPKRSLTSLLSTSLHRSTYLHVSPPFSPEDVHALLAELDKLALHPSADTGGDGDAWRPKIVFEPHPGSCHPGQRVWLERILGRVEVVSPNHDELFSIYSRPLVAFDDPALRPTVESLIRHMLSVGVGRDGQGVVAVRCGRMGSCIGTRQGGVRWVAAYFGGEGAERGEGRVKDVTGAGNAYLGGFIAGLWLSGGDAFEAALYGTVASSFMVEQFGLPFLEQSGGEQGDGEEMWNGERPMERVDKLRRTLA